MRRLAWAVAIVSLASCGRGDPAGTAPSPEADTAREAAYVGRDACRPCHAETWSTFARTGMGRSWYPLSGAPVIEDWTRRNTVEIEATGLRYRMVQRDGRFYMRQSLVDRRGEESAVDERELLWVVGSAHHSRAYLVESAGKLFQAPVCWFTQDAVWDLCPGYEIKNDYFSREIGRTCVFCHNARMELLPGARNAYEGPIPHGIDCERCHGPGGRHVERWAQGDTPTGMGDPAIVNPRRLSATLRMQICFQCHLGDSKATERVARYDATLEDWRPGQPISAAMVPFRFSETTAHDFGLSAQADRLLLTRCFTESGGRLECVTCHDPHVTVYRRDRPPDFFTSKCLGCHVAEACGAPAAKRAATAPPDDCVRCHMRKSEPDDHRHADFTDHWIRTRIDEPREERTRFEVEPYLPASFAELPPAERDFYEGMAISLRAHSVPPEKQSSMWPEATLRFLEAGGLEASRAEVPYFLGKSLTAQGKHREAAQAYAVAHRLDPADANAAFAHGQSLLRQKRFDEAEALFEAMLRDHPGTAAPAAELARSRAARQDYARALELYRKAAALEPWNASLHENAAKILFLLGRKPEAIAAAEEALRAEPENVSVHRTLAELRARR